jgi:MFS transporter, DHA1 family, tetracycline resistance protein
MTVRRNAALGFIFITVLVDVIGWGIIIPVMPKLVQQLTGRDLNDSSTIGGWLLFAYAIMQFLFSPVLGGLSDKYGRRPVLLFALLGFGADYLFQALAPTIQWLFVGRIIAGITGASFTTASAYIADVSTPEKRAQNFGLIGAAFGIGFIVGPMIGGFCSDFGPRVPFYVAAVFTFLNFLYGYFVLPESLLKENRRSFSWKRANPLGTLRQLRKYPVVAGLSVSLLLLYIASHAVQSNWSYYTMFKFTWDAKMVGISLGAIGLLVGAVQGGLIRIIIPKIGQIKAVYIGLLLYMTGMIFFGVASQGWMMFAILVPYCMGGICGPSMQGIMSSQVPPDAQGELQGALTSLMSLSAIIGPVFMTNLFSYYSTKTAKHIYLPGAPFFAGAILVLLGLLYALRSLRRYVAAQNAQAAVAATGQTG